MSKSISSCHSEDQFFESENLISVNSTSNMREVDLPAQERRIICTNLSIDAVLRVWSSKAAQSIATLEREDFSSLPEDSSIFNELIESVMHVLLLLGLLLNKLLDFPDILLNFFKEEWGRSLFDPSHSVDCVHEILDASRLFKLNVVSLTLRL